MRFLRIVASLFLLFLLFFLLAGVSSSNDWETDPSSPVSAGMLGKIVLVPICVVLGLLLFKVAGPLFGGTRLAARSEKYQTQARARVSGDNRYRMGDALPVAYGAAVFGLIFVLAGIITGDVGGVVLGIVLGVSGLIIRGRLESQRVAAKAIGARTLGDEVADTLKLAGTVTVGLASFAIESAILGGKALARKVGEAVRSENSIDASLTLEGTLREYGGANQGNFDVEKFLVAFIGILRTNYDTHLKILRSPRVATQIKHIKYPVLTGRRHLLDVHTSIADNEVRAHALLTGAISQFDSGAVTPDSSEWPIEGPEVGRGHACMWGGIARTFAHMQHDHTFGVDATNSDAWFGVGSLIFLEAGDLTMAGRAIQEWGESRRLAQDFEGADALFLAAACIFVSAGEKGRAHTASTRVNAHEHTNIDSSFFLHRPPTEQEVALLSTVLGGRNSAELYDSLA